MRFKTALAVLGVVVVLAAGFIVRALWRAGTFKTLEPHFAGTCRLVEGPLGPEDLTIHPQTAVAYISAADRRAAAVGNPVPGAIFSYDLEVVDAQPVNSTPDADITFQPHGISLWVGEDGREALFVINHPPPGTGSPAHTVEIFDIEGGKLIHRTSLTDPLLVMPNDLVAVGRDEFYLTNTHAHPPGAMQTLETYLELPGANILHYGDGGFRPAVEDLVFPNGINTSPGGETIYVATTTPRALLAFDRDAETGALTPRDELFIGTGGDNIEVDAHGTLWIGAHPQLLRTVAHQGDPAELAPSQVLRVTPASSGGYAVDEIYLNLGDQISAASVGARSGQRLLIGQIFGNGFLDCLME